MSRISSIHTERGSALDYPVVADVVAFKNLYKRMNRDSITFEMLADVYGADFVFTDPFHNISGLTAYYDYCVSMYQNVSSIEFDFHDEWTREDAACLSWTMQFKHRHINRGKAVAVDGTSVLQFRHDAIVLQRDYFDGGQALYQHLPLLGSVITRLKKRMTP